MTINPTRAERRETRNRPKMRVHGARIRQLLHRGAKPKKTVKR